MRLINNELLALEEFMGSAPNYAILSHTWEDGEVTFQDFTNPNSNVRSQKKGFGKILRTCDMAKRAGIKYSWVDTCCIDKTSSAELTEAINSMFQWYRDAVVCYTWLADLPKEKSPDSRPSTQQTCITGLEGCRWFTRGWTLQELIAPMRVEFYDQEWHFRGTKADISDQLVRITNISDDVLRDPECMHRLSIAQRMSWAARRQTTRIEDTAYCLLGIFDVNMPMMYGEGARAFIRLQEAIAGESNDFSLFAWKASADDHQMYRGVFATSPSEFRGSASIRVVRDAVFNPEFLMTNKGLRMNTSIFAGQSRAYFLGLNCSESQTSDSNAQEVGIWIQQRGGGVYSRVRCHEYAALPPGQVAKLGRIFLSRRISPSLSEELESSQNHAFVFRNGFNEANVATNAPEFPFEVIQFAPSEQWDSQGRMFVTHGAGDFAAYGYFMPRFGSFHADELSGAESFILAFGRVPGEEEPWVCIASAREDIEIFQAQGDAKKVAAAARRKRNNRMVLLRDCYQWVAKAVRVSLEKTMTGGQMVYCIDLEYTEAPEIHLTGQDGALSHPESFAYRERHGIGQRSIGRKDSSSSLTNLWIAENFLDDV
ncbi:HET domain protein [Dactylonectria estremocensis]|uniref:HET domain protein n=1 Tax=Dactylonectria estremocensis TaxID=1079267 RepID=A0A9P9ERQ9_9HYPO|nr:HET domain protein [Dactylonectria estremocensis]